MKIPKFTKEEIFHTIHTKSYKTALVFGCFSPFFTNFFHTPIFVHTYSMPYDPTHCNEKDLLKK